MRRPVISRRGALVSGMAFAAARAALAQTVPALVRSPAFSPAATLKSDDGRAVQVWIWPAAGRERGVILFSHGALSSPLKYQRLVGPWAQAGFKVLAPLHVDSTDNPDHARYGMKDGWAARLLDMHALAAFAGAPSYVAAGHSYGALVALTLGGAAAIPPPGLVAPLSDPRARCVVAFSPPGPSPGLVTAEGYSHLGVPALIETGTADNPPVAMGGGDYHGHLTAFDVATPGDRYALVLEGVDHYFGGLICRPELPGPPQTAGLQRALAVSTDFLEAFGAGDGAARLRLDAAVKMDGEVGLRLKE